MESNEINKYLVKYEGRIKSEIGHRLNSSKRANLFDRDDITQEVMISLFLLFRDKYNPEISSPDTFLQTHLIYLIYKAIKDYSRSMGYTGKNSKKRTGSKLIDNKSVSLDLNSFDSLSSDQRPVHKSRNVGNRPESNNLFRNILSSYGSKYDSEDDILELVYCDQVKREVLSRLHDKKDQEIFILIVQQDDNPSFSTGITLPEKSLSIKEIADELGYKSKWAVNESLKRIRRVTSEVIAELED